jgi:transcriptional regulator with XRE-family HTH domain
VQNNLFGIFLKEKRQQNNMSLRELSIKANISHTYILNIENGNKPPPSDVALKRLEKALNLDKESSNTFFDLAAKCKQINDDKNIYLPADVSDYLARTETAKKVIREVDKLGCSNEIWNEILKQLKTK